MSEEKKMIRKSILVNPELWTRFKVYVIQNDLKITECVNEAFLGFMKSKEELSNETK